MIIAGIDPGFSGAVTILKDNEKPIMYDMPVLKVGKKQEINAISIKAILSCCSHIYIEKVGSMPGQGISSTARYHKSAGIIIGICIGLGIPYTEVHPRTWKSAMMKDMPKEKEASIMRAQQLFPDIDFPRKKDHGKADSLLIAVWGTRNHH